MTHTQNTEPSITHKAVVLGSPIEHSRSPLLHNTGYQALGMHHWRYERKECTAEQLPGLLDQLDPSYRGCSVTMPAKFAALQAASKVSDRAQAIGSANTLVRQDAGWFADNTDVDGVAGALKELGGGSFNAKRAVIIGAGGTARPAVYALATLGVEAVLMINRSNREAEFRDLVQNLGISLDFRSIDEVAKAVESAEVLVSTVPSKAIADRAHTIARVPLLDVIYDPWPTPLMQAASTHGVPVVGGHVMLAEQAYGQFEQFTGQPAPKEAMRSALERDLGIG
ncbi:shikimate dehydrogenase [Corynebacterium pelargi]|uniref:shikimate dehydrogenase (NADP(+)) n=1 Tax=Corynebacterium pelargi TaxID=1471400 RepID=A0A410W8J7_9CORY|nr:shikimate dehydrogenase [Corynebacterium pelargi]QAU52287.1 Shikimate dehydrogenase [Corynebacterium pelargi]GGG68777.1 shikimate dehydrogenase [Corynebacterium pelargi]